MMGLGVLASGVADLFPAAIRLALAVSVLVWLPGALLLEHVFGVRLRSRFTQVALQFFVGLAVASLLGWLFGLLGASFRAFSVSLKWACLLFAGGVWLRRMRAPGDPGTAGTGAGAGRATDFAILVVAVVAAVVMGAGVPEPGFDEDALDHIGHVRQILSQNTLSPTGVLATPVDGAPPPADPRKGGFHALAAVLADASALTADALWPRLSMFMYPLALMAFLSFCAVFVRRDGLLLVCAAAFVLFAGGHGFHSPETAAYGRDLAMAFYWMLTAVVFAFVAHGGAVAARGRRGGWLLGVLVAGGIAAHLGVILHTAVLILTLLLFQRWLDVDRRAVGRVALVAGATAIAAGLGRVGWHDANEIHSHAQGLLFISDRWFVMSPLELIRDDGLVFFGALLLVPFMIAVSRSRDIRRCAAFTVLPVAIGFVPLVTVPLYNAGSYMVFRVVSGAPAIAAAVTGLAALTVWARRRGTVARIAATVVLFLWADVFVVPGVAAVVREARAGDGGDRIAAEYPALLEFAKRLPDGSVVLSDPKTSYWLSAMADVRVVAVSGQHGNPYDAQPFARLRAVRNVLSPYTYDRETFTACERYDVDYVVVNGRLDTRRPDPLLHWDASFFGDAVAKLTSFRQRFRPVFESDRVRAFEYAVTSKRPQFWFPNEEFVRRTADNVTPCDVQTPVAALDVVAFGVTPAKVLPGETVQVTVGYRTRDLLELGMPLVLHVRFDHQRIGESRYPGEKYVRRFQERRTGRWLRHRVDHHPFGGRYARDLWPIDQPFYETFDVWIPPRMALGEYRVELSVATEPLIPNYTVADFFYNRDHYSGKACATIEVTEFVER